MKCIFQAKQIALNGQEFVRNHLMADDIFCYHVLLFQVSSLIQSLFVLHRVGSHVEVFVIVILDYFGPLVAN